MGSKSAPAPPDYQGAAKATAEGSKEVTQAQTFANRPTQNTPWGSSTWVPGVTRDPATGKEMTTWEQNLTLSPAEQAALESQQAVQQGRSELAEGLVSRAGQELSNPVDWRGLPATGEVPTSGMTVEGLDYSGAPEISMTDFSSLGMPENVDYGALPGLDAGGGYQQSFADTFYDRSASLLEPRMERQREAADNRLRNQGLVPGTEAYDRAMGDIMTSQGETMGRLAQDAVFAGADEQQRQFGREATARSMFGGEAQQEFGNDAYLRELMGGDMQQQFSNEAFMRDLIGGEREAEFAGDMALSGQRFDQSREASTYQNLLRQQAIAEEAQRRGMSINDMNALLSGQQVGTPQMPNFNTAAAASPADYLRAAEGRGQFDQQTYSTALGPLNSLLANQGISFGGGG